MSVKAVFTFGITPKGEELRKEVFLEEQGYREDVDDEDKTAIELVLFLNDEAIATARMYEVDPETYHVGRVCVKKEFRGKEIGHYAMRFLEVKAKSLGVRKLILGAQLEKKGFYEKCGYHVSDGELFFEEGHPHIHMEKILERPKYHRRKG